ncbi:RNA polymerase subunit sigma-70 [Dysgonamonadaceae bacterium]|nr:RNA polymerase subunit sigma-70 [Dysgonamonadaceae bacterium]
MVGMENNKTHILQLTNEQLLERFQTEDKKIYFDELFKRYIPLLYGLCLKCLKNSEEAKNAVMEIYGEVITNRSLYIIKNFHDWLYTFAKNHCLHEMRKSNSRRFAELVDDKVNFEKEFTLFDGNRSSEEEKALSVCLKKLNENQRKCLEYFYNDHKSYVEIVAMTGNALAKVKSYIVSGRRNLERCIAKELKKAKKEDFDQL